MFQGKATLQGNPAQTHFGFFLMKKKSSVSLSLSLWLKRHKTLLSFGRLVFEAERKKRDDQHRNRHQHRQHVHRIQPRQPSHPEVRRIHRLRPPRIVVRKNEPRDQKETDRVVLCSMLMYDGAKQHFPAQPVRHCHWNHPCSWTSKHCSCSFRDSAASTIAPTKCEIVKCKLALENIIKYVLY